MKKKMEGLDLRTYRERRVRGGASMRWVHGDANLANSLTKSGGMHQLDTCFVRSQRSKTVSDPSFESAKKRRAKGLKFLEWRSG